MAPSDPHTLIQTGLATSAVRGRTATRTWILRLVSGDDAIRIVTIGARPIVVGAQGDCDVVLDDPKVSRRHAELSACPGGVSVRDLNSSNGTWWQGSRLTEAVVPAGAVLRFGDSEATVNAADVPLIPPSKRGRFGGLVGTSPSMRELFAVLEMASPTDATVVIEGESGTGKEVAARAIHDHSQRAAGPFVVVDCSAISEQLVESHLFGHVKGSFTGATSDRRGAFLEANGGTIFLDEIGELSPLAQTKLLRALEAQTVQPVGSDRTIPVDTRVIAATHRDLSHRVDRGEFRLDLFYRIAVVHAHIAPLRDRPGDLIPLVQHFYEGRDIAPGLIEGPNLDRLRGYTWPGNVRELRNVLERGWALSGTVGCSFANLRLFLRDTPLAAFGAADAVAAIDPGLPFKDAKERWIDVFEREYLRQVFDRFGGNITHAATHAGINRRHFRTLLRKHEIIDGVD